MTKAYRPICLSSFLFKTVLKPLEKFIRGTYLGPTQVVDLPSKWQIYHKSNSRADQHHQRGNRSQASGVAFIDLYGVFDNTSYVAIERILENKNTPKYSSLRRNWQEYAQPSEPIEGGSRGHARRS